MPDDLATHTITVTMFVDEYAASQHAGKITLPQLAKQIGEKTATDKKALPWLKLAVFGENISAAGCYRTNDNLIEISGIEAEHDAGTLSFDDMRAILVKANIRCLLYTTPSYVPEMKERWRILAPLSEHAAPELRKQFVARLNGVLAGALGWESFGLSRAFIWGHIEGAPYRVEVLDGDFIDRRDDLDAGAIFENQGKAPHDRPGNFFRQVNNAALADLKAWVLELFPNAAFQPGTGAWRVTSADLGRELEEDLSIHPAGITDWGIDDQGEAPRAGRYTAIDLVIEHGGAADAKQAAFWLCEKMGITPESLGWGGLVTYLNKIHAVLPIGGSGKTRVVTFGELEDFPGRQTVVMTQTFEDFAALFNKYRHTWIDENGEEHSVGQGSFWLASPQRRQYDGGMAFMPQHDGDTGNKMNLWRGFGVQPIKPNGKSGAAGCRKFLDFAHDIVCSGNEENYDYLIKREAFIVQKRTRSEVALVMRTRDEGAGKGRYEVYMRRLLGNHAMLIVKPDHIVGKFNPHLEALLRLTVDEALFVGNPAHRNTLFTTITEPELTIEPKFCGAYNARNHLNISILGNPDHIVQVSSTARRFFIPTVSAARIGDFAYFDAINAEMENGGYEALLYHLLHEIDLRDFNVRKVPQTDELRRQRNLSLPPMEAWWAELLESGTLWGSDPREPHRAVSNAYQRSIRVEGTASQTRQITQPGLYDQARALEPRLKIYTSDLALADHLTKMKCTNITKVLRKRGWTFPPLAECRKEWVKRYPGWVWRDPEIAAWRAEETDDANDHHDPEQRVREDFAERVFIELLASHDAETSTAAAAFAAEPAAVTMGLRQDDLEKAMQRLLTVGRIKIENGKLKASVLS